MWARRRKLRMAIDRTASLPYFFRMGGAGIVASMETVATPDDRYTAERYFRLVDEGVLQPDDRVELLDGVIVSMPPSAPPHATSASKVVQALILALGDRACVRSQLPLVASPLSVVEPDAAVVPGTLDDYRAAHPTTAHLAVEVADSSLPEDRLTKARIYAAARIPEYWIVNLREDVVEVLRKPDARTRRYRERQIACRGQRLTLAALPEVRVAVDDLLPAG